MRKLFLDKICDLKKAEQMGGGQAKPYGEFKSHEKTPIS